MRLPAGKIVDAYGWKKLLQPACRSQRATACLQEPPQPSTAADDPASFPLALQASQQLATASACSP